MKWLKLVVLSLRLPDITVRETRDNSGVPGRINTGSPSGSRASGTTSVSGIFLRKHQKIKDDLAILESDTTCSPDVGRARALMLEKHLQDLGVQKIIQDYQSDPDFYDQFGMNANDL